MLSRKTHSLCCYYCRENVKKAKRTKSVPFRTWQCQTIVQRRIYASQSSGSPTGKGLQALEDCYQMILPIVSQCLGVLSRPLENPIRDSKHASRAWFEAATLMTKKDTMQRHNIMWNAGMWEVVTRWIMRKRYVGRGCQNKTL